MKQFSSKISNHIAPAGVRPLGRFKKLLLLVAIAVFTSVYSFAGTGTKELEASNTLKTALDKEFTGASGIKWYSDDNKTFMARFTLNERNVTAYFDGEGHLLATRRYVDAVNLPLAVSTKLAQRYPSETIRWIVEFQSEGATAYYITLEGSNTWKVIKANASGDLSVHQRLKKA
ncbi:hypothetical protein [Chitinophaga silvisoli]|uniref:Uncharacterized protein n=1 Tax=Chitinophaga silvisoli TaxID=2291814 RepID=A0A3E1P576_9BACT|nr:hypothetical protein [Chitinophaga silvisoli]RFM35332.1 hypothetical protein DXN04_08045 [Chitinophaga silvisoli]